MKTSILFLVLLFAPLGCAFPERTQSDVFSQVFPTENNPPFDLYLTFDGYNGGMESDPEDAIIVLNGEVMGKGKNGMLAVLLELHMFRNEYEHRRILVYPDYYQQPNTPSVFPFDNYRWLVQAALEKSKIKFVFSMRDENGNIVGWDRSKIRRE